ncbi:MAG: spore germination protein, partial [Clostridia bacterium]|nr:spore germination protein [Clostridia bacterium]
VNYQKDRENLTNAFNGSKDILMLDTKALGRSAVLCFIDGMSNKEIIDRNVIEPLKKCDYVIDREKITKNSANDCIDLKDLRLSSDCKECDLEKEDSEGFIDGIKNIISKFTDKEKGEEDKKEDYREVKEGNEKLPKDNILLRDQNIVKLKDKKVITADLINQIIYISDPIIVCDNFEEMVNRIVSGDVGFIIDGAENYFVLSLRDYKMRGITEPPISTVLRGPREGFVEDMKINMTMLRRRFKTPDLVFDLMQVGKYSGTNIAIAYVYGIADNSIVEEIKKRIKEIDCDGIVDSSYIARYIEDNKYSLFNQIGMAEKPDIVAGKMLEGRVAIICDGSPTVLTLPFVLYEHFQASEDYYIKSYRASATRILRIIAMIIAISLPAAYVALQEFQYHMFPLKFLVVIMNSLQGVPLTPTIEMIVLLLVFEILNEASIRMPRYVGTALSIVGAIVLGESAVSAGLLSVPTLLVTAISTIGLYCVPNEVEAGSILRILFVAIAGVLGIFGLLLAIILLFAYMVSLKNFGTSYLAPFAPMLPSDMKDTLSKANLIDMQKRPFTIPTKNRTRSK